MTSLARLALALSIWLTASAASAQHRAPKPTELVPVDPVGVDAPETSASEERTELDVEIDELLERLRERSEPVGEDELAAEAGLSGLRPAASVGETTAPSNEEPGRHVPFGTLLLGAYLGELAAMAAGALLGLLGAAISGCDNGEGWIGGYTCFAGYGYAASIGALVAMPVGTVSGLWLAADQLDVPIHGDAILGTAIGLAPSALITPLTYLSTFELSATLLAAFVVPLGLSPVLATVFYADTIHSEPGFAAVPYVRGVAGGGEAGVSGRF